MLIENFNSGILSDPGELPAGTFAFSKIENLRVNDNGFLIPSARVMPTLFSAIPHPIEGVASKVDLVFLVSGGKLYSSIGGNYTS